MSMGAYEHGGAGVEGGEAKAVYVLVPCPHGTLRERDARGPGARARARAVRCAHALLRRVLLHQVDVDQARDSSFRRFSSTLRRRSCTAWPQFGGSPVMGEVSGLGGTVGAWRRPALLSYSLVLQTTPPSPRPNSLGRAARAPSHTQREKSPWSASSPPQAWGRGAVVEASGCRPPALQPH